MGKAGMQGHVLRVYTVRPHCEDILVAWEIGCQPSPFALTISEVIELVSNTANAREIAFTKVFVSSIFSATAPAPYLFS